MSSFIFVIHISGPADRVWQALTRPDFTLQYWAGRMLVSDWTEGAALKLTKGDGSLDWTGRVLEYQPPNRLSFAFAVPSIVLGKRDPVTRVLFDISQFGPVTQLTASHDGYDADTGEFDLIMHDWPALLTDLKETVEGPDQTFAWRA